MNWKTPLTLAAAIGLAACGDDETPTPPGIANVRVAHLSPDAPAVDFCIAPHGTAAFEGPVMEALGVSGGLAYQEVTAYLGLEEGRYDVRLVASDATTCATGLLPDVTGLPTLTDGLYATIAAIGALDPGEGFAPFEVTAFVDESAVMGGKAKLRFVHASPNTPSVDVGLGSGEAFTAVFTDVAFGGIETGTGFANGYVEVDPLVGVTISARATGTTDDALVLEGVDLPAGAIATAFATGLLPPGEPPLQALVCVDNGEPVDLVYTPCVALPQPE
jgi:hypothetical protein